MEQLFMIESVLGLFPEDMLANSSVGVEYTSYRTRVLSRVASNSPIKQVRTHAHIRMLCICRYLYQTLTLSGYPYVCLTHTHTQGKNSPFYSPMVSPAQRGSTSSALNSKLLYTPAPDPQVPTQAVPGVCV
jgi:hypothetical protein